MTVAANAHRVDVDTMSSEESAAMLTNRLEQPSANLGAFHALANRLGRWPLLLDLAGSVLRLRMAFGDTVEGALNYINHALDKKGVFSLDQANPSDRHQSMNRTIEISTRFVGLRMIAGSSTKPTIFPEDVDIPLSAAGALWGLAEFETTHTALHFADLSLIKYDLQSLHIHLHDVIRSFVTEQLLKRSVDPSTLHARLVGTWGDPDRLPDAYAWHYLAYHLVAAGQSDRLKKLLLDYDWIRSKLSIREINSVLRDYDRSRRFHSPHDPRGDSALETTL